MVPNWLSDQRGVPRGGTEVVRSERYVVGGANSNVPCVKSRTGDKKGTRCYAESSKKRKYCKFIVEDRKHMFPQGIYLNGVGEGREINTECKGRLNVFTNETDNYDLSTPGTTLIMGPFKDERGKIAVKCMRVEDVFLFEQLEYLMQSLVHEGDVFVPSLRMLRTFLNSGSARGQLETKLKRLCQPYEAYEKITRTLPNNKKLRDASRVMAKYMFMLGMYNLKWAGPDRPYPTTDFKSRKEVGSSSNPISDKLKGKYVSVTPKGLLSVRERGDLKADDVNEDKRLHTMEHALIQAIHVQETLLTEEEKQKLIQFFLSSVRTPCVTMDDHTYFPSTEEGTSLFQTVETHNPRYGVHSCVRSLGSTLVRGSLMAIDHLYKTRPPWSKLDGMMGQINCMDATDWGGTNMSEEQRDYYENLYRR